jgi:hypothetical protein
VAVEAPGDCFCGVQGVGAAFRVDGRFQAEGAAFGVFRGERQCRARCFQFAFEVAGAFDFAAGSTSVSATTSVKPKGLSFETVVFPLVNAV